MDYTLLEYIRNNRAQGHSLEQIRQSLVAAGWTPADVAQALGVVAASQPKSPKPWLLVVAGIVIVVLGGGVLISFFVFGSGGSGGSGGTQVDCGADMGCLINASNACHPAKLSGTTTLEKFGVQLTLTTFSEIKGLDAEGNCVLYLKILGQDVAGGMISLEGQDATCTFSSTPDLTALLDDLNAGNLLEGGRFSCELLGTDLECVVANADCTGSLVGRQDLVVVVEETGSIECGLQSGLASLSLLYGVSSSVSVSGFASSAGNVSWASGNSSIATVEPPATGALVMVKAEGLGSASIIATDTSVGPECNIVIQVEVHD